MVKLIVKDQDPVEDEAEEIRATFSPELPSKVNPTLSAMRVPPGVVREPGIFLAVRPHHDHAHGGGEASQVESEPAWIHEPVIVGSLDFDPLGAAREVGPA